MTTPITRDQMQPGQLVAHVTYYVVRGDRQFYGPDVHRLEQVGDDTWHLVRGRWRVRWHPPFSFLGAHNSGFWIAEEQDRRDGVDGDHEWRAFDTWAEAITYADRMARQA